MNILLIDGMLCSNLRAILDPSIAAVMHAVLTITDSRPSTETLFHTTISEYPVTAGQVIVQRQRPSSTRPSFTSSSGPRRGARSARRPCLRQHHQLSQDQSITSIATEMHAVPVCSIFSKQPVLVMCSASHLYDDMRPRTAYVSMMSDKEKVVGSHGRQSWNFSMKVCENSVSK
jgi:hypothetical protein